MRTAGSFDGVIGARGWKPGAKVVVQRHGGSTRGGRMRKMYVAALAQPLSVEYLLLDPVQYASAKDHPDGLYEFVRRTPGLDGDAVRFTSIRALREHCRENGIEIAGDLHGCPGERGTPRTGSGVQ